MKVQNALPVVSPLAQLGKDTHRSVFQLTYYIFRAVGLVFSDSEHITLVIVVQRFKIYSIVTVVSMLKLGGLSNDINARNHGE